MVSNLYIGAEDLEGEIRVSLTPFKAKFSVVKECTTALVLRTLEDWEFWEARQILKDNYKEWQK